MQDVFKPLPCLISCTEVLVDRDWYLMHRMQSLFFTRLRIIIILSTVNCRIEPFV